MRSNLFFIPSWIKPLAACVLALISMGTASAQVQAQSLFVPYSSASIETDSAGSKDGSKGSQIGSYTYYTALALGLGVGLSHLRGTNHHSSLGNLPVLASARLYMPSQKPLEYGIGSGADLTDSTGFAADDMGSVTFTSPLAVAFADNAGQSADVAGFGSDPASDSPRDAMLKSAAVSDSDSATVPTSNVPLTERILSAASTITQNSPDSPRSTLGFDVVRSADAAEAASAPEPGQWLVMGLMSISVMGLILRARLRSRQSIPSCQQ